MQLHAADMSFWQRKTWPGCRPAGWPLPATTVLIRFRIRGFGQAVRRRRVLKIDEGPDGVAA